MTQKDPFYDADLQNDPLFQQELEEHEEEQSLDEMMDQIVEEDHLEVDAEPRENWQMTSDEEKLLAQLLKKKEAEDQIFRTFRSLESKPSQEQIDDWKAKFGDVYLVSLSQHENFIFRALKRQEWRQLIAQVAKMPEAKKTDAIVMRGVVWPKLTESTIAVLTAGAPETIRSLIFEASNFIEPERAVQLVRKL
jgi:hypothetical protein